MAKNKKFQLCLDFDYGDFEIFSGSYRGDSVETIWTQAGDDCEQIRQSERQTTGLSHPSLHNILYHRFVSPFNNHGAEHGNAAAYYCPSASLGQYHWR